MEENDNCNTKNVLYKKINKKIFKINPTFDII